MLKCLFFYFSFLIYDFLLYWFRYCEHMDIEGLLATHSCSMWSVSLFMLIAQWFETPALHTIYVTQKWHVRFSFTSSLEAMKLYFQVSSQLLIWSRSSCTFVFNQCDCVTSTASLLWKCVNTSLKRPECEKFNIHKLECVSAWGEIRFGEVHLCLRWALAERCFVSTLTKS